MNVFESASYQDALRDRVLELKTEGREVNFRWLAEKIPMQSTLLSRVLNKRDVHMSEDNLFRACHLLSLRDDERDFVFLLRSRATSKSKEHREHLSRRIEDVKRKRMHGADVIDSVSGERAVDEAAYMLNPLAVVLVTAAQSKVLRKDLRQVGAELGMSPEEFKRTMRLVEKAGFLKLGANEWTVKEVCPQPRHFGRSHPFTRAHQAMLRANALQQMMRMEEARKTSLMAIFTMDERGFESLKKELEGVYAKAREISERSRDAGVYQIGLDLFRWV